MPRSRNLKPGFFTNDDLAECGPLGHLLFAGLWVLADREGRILDRPKKIKAETLPYYDADAEHLLAQLAERGFILRYAAGDGRYIQIMNWGKHQTPHYKELGSVIPPPPGHVDSPIVTFGVPPDQRDRILDRDGRRCVECGAGDDVIHRQVVARSKGGSGADENLRALCRRCNSSKNNRDAASMSAQRRPDFGSSKSLDDLLIPDTGYLIPDTSNPPTPHDERAPIANDPEFEQTPSETLAKVWQKPAPNPNPVNDTEAHASGGDAARSAPYRLFQALCEQTGSDEADVPKSTKDKQLGIVKNLLAKQGEDDIAGCIRWLASWRTVAWDMRTVASEIDKWIMQGRPSASKISPNGRRPNQADLNASRPGEVVL